MLKVLVTLFLLAGSLSLAGCKTSTAVGVGVVGDSLLTSAYYDDYYGRDYYDTYGYYNDGYYWDRYDGRWYNRNGYWARISFWDNAGDQTQGIGDMQISATGKVAHNPVHALTRKYKLSTAAAQNVLRAFRSVRSSGNVSALAAYGIDKDVLQRIASGQLPSKAQRHAIAARLQTSPQSIQRLLKDIMNEYSLQNQFNFHVK
jgi:hypothetical protein